MTLQDSESLGNLQLGPNAHTHTHTHSHTFMHVYSSHAHTNSHTHTHRYTYSQIHTNSDLHTHSYKHTHTHRTGRRDDTALCELGHIGVALSPSEGVAQSTGGSQVHPGSLGGTFRLPCPQTRTIRIFVPPTTSGLHPRASSPLPTFLPWHFPPEPYKS